MLNGENPMWTLRDTGPCERLFVLHGIPVPISLDVHQMADSEPFRASPCCSHPTETDTRNLFFCFAQPVPEFSCSPLQPNQTSCYQENPPAKTCHSKRTLRLVEFCDVAEDSGGSRQRGCAQRQSLDIAWGGGEGEENGTSGFDSGTDGKQRGCPTRGHRWQETPLSSPRPETKSKCPRDGPIQNALKLPEMEGGGTNRAVLNRKNSRPGTFNGKSTGKKWPYFGENRSTSGKTVVSGTLGPSTIHPKPHKNAFFIFDI